MTPCFLQALHARRVSLDLRLILGWAYGSIWIVCRWNDAKQFAEQNPSKFAIVYLSGILPYDAVRCRMFANDANLGPLSGHSINLLKDLHHPWYTQTHIIRQKARMALLGIDVTYDVASSGFCQTEQCLLFNLLLLLLHLFLCPSFSLLCTSKCFQMQTCPKYERRKKRHNKKGEQLHVSTIPMKDFTVQGEESQSIVRLLIRA